MPVEPFGERSGDLNFEVWFRTGRNGREPKTETEQTARKSRCRTITETHRQNMNTRFSAVVNATPHEGLKSGFSSETEWAALKVLGIHRVLDSELSASEKEEFIDAILSAAEEERLT